MSVARLYFHVDPAATAPMPRFPNLIPETSRKLPYEMYMRYQDALRTTFRGTQQSGSIVAVSTAGPAPRNFLPFSPVSNCNEDRHESAYSKKVGQRTKLFLKGEEIIAHNHLLERSSEYGVTSASCVHCHIHCHVGFVFHIIGLLVRCAKQPRL